MILSTHYFIFQLRLILLKADTSDTSLYEKLTTNGRRDERADRWLFHFCFFRSRGHAIRSHFPLKWRCDKRERWPNVGFARNRF